MTATARGLAKFHTVPEIEAFWRAVLTAKLQRSSVNLHINQTSSPDGQAAASVNLTTAAEQEQFMADCEAALAIKTDSAPNMPRPVDFSQRRIEV